ncbi:DUF4349 domain-containing protein [Chryseobacterium sp. MP_3.2]|uniref:DUF4349 domain-containing protein n=1 Tax=Chryseobacterium sp. MP_3.2 TaxID=3071712 RepID=UPI002E0134FB|nr:hypothetical protein [Chryseobacterium sp. MP_3.2]
MKNFFLIFLFSVALLSCDKNAIQQTSDSIKSADSLFMKANEGFKTLDSISKTINDSDGIAKRVILPEIQKQKKVIDSTIRSGGYRIDSINKEIEKITKGVVVGTDVVKTLDSANDALNNGESPLKVLTRTANKILRQTARKDPPKQTSKEDNSVSARQENPVIVSPVDQKDPIVKSGNLEIEVENISDGKSILRSQLQRHNAEMVTEKFSQTEGFEREYITVKVPLRDFDALVMDLSRDLGEVRLKSTESEGSDYLSNQMCDLEITLVQKENSALLPLGKSDAESKPDTFGEKSSGAFMSGFKVLGGVLLAILPFWPIFLIGGIVWYFVRRNKKNRKPKFGEEPMLEPLEIKEEQEISDAEIVEIKKEDPTDYSKYLPKE